VVISHEWRAREKQRLNLLPITPRLSLLQKPAIRHRDFVSIFDVFFLDQQLYFKGVIWSG